MTGQYPLELLGDGQQTRCFTHVKDIANGVITVAQHKNGQNRDFNVGSDKEIKMIDLAKKIWEVMEIKKPFKVKFIPGLKFDIKRRVPNVAKIRSLIGWQQEVKFEDGLKEVVLWLKEQKARGKLKR